MGCGKQSQNGTPGAIIVSEIARSPVYSAYFASPLQLKEEEHKILSNLQEEDNQSNIYKSRVSNFLESIFQGNNKEGWTDLSKIPNIKDQETMRHLTLKLQTSNGLLVHNGELDSVQGFNFDFLNESSDSTKHLNQIIKDAYEELENIKTE